MTLIVDALDRVAREVSLTSPSSWVSTTADEYLEIRDDFLLETVEDISDRVDLPSPVSAQTTITGTGVETYSLPSTFKRMQRDDLAVYQQAFLHAVQYVAHADGHAGDEVVFSISDGDI